jgi:hypothetical protein
MVELVVIHIKGYELVIIHRERVDMVQKYELVKIEYELVKIEYELVKMGYELLKMGYELVKITLVKASTFFGRNYMALFL